MKLPFTVDAALLRELGEHLIGQPHIALAELIKNAFDADARTCKVTIGNGEIIVSDNGHGMSLDVFTKRWMRIGTTQKAKEAFSPGGRRLTGSKGVGRLAVQYLADEITLETKAVGHPTVTAVVDWTSRESFSDLTQVVVDVEETDAVGDYPDSSATGTRIVLTKLRSDWDIKSIQDLGREVWLLRSPFRRRTGRLGVAGEFDIEFEATHIPDAKENFDRALEEVFSTWKAKIVGDLKRGRRGSRAEINVEFKANYGYREAEIFRDRVDLPIQKEDGEKPLVDDVYFEILIFRPEGRQSSGVSVAELREFLWKYGNVSIYDTGFRLPYYGADHDWLDLGRDQARRLDSSALLPSSLKIDARYMLDLPATGRIFGSVDISTNHERDIVAEDEDDEWLQIQVGRDRLLDNRAYRQLVDLIKYSLHLYANRYRVRLLRTSEEAPVAIPATVRQKRALEVLARYREAIPTAVYSEVVSEVEQALEASETAERTASEQVGLLAPLAAAGMAALALNHELAREEHFVRDAVERLQSVARRLNLGELSELAADLERSSDRLASLQELFAPLISDEDRTATRRLRVRPVLEQTISGMRTLMPGVVFDLSSVPGDLAFPLGSLSEWNALLQNVISNAWNAMLGNGGRRIGFVGSCDGRGREALRISDDGVGLGTDVNEATVLFEPFKRSLSVPEDLQSMALGGQGLGLAIVRMIARRRAVSVRFVEAPKGYNTTFEMSWKG